MFQPPTTRGPVLIVEENVVPLGAQKEISAGGQLEEFLKFAGEMSLLLEAALVRGPLHGAGLSEEQERFVEALFFEPLCGLAIVRIANEAFNGALADSESVRETADIKSALPRNSEKLCSTAGRPRRPKYRMTPHFSPPYVCFSYQSACGKSMLLRASTHFRRFPDSCCGEGPSGTQRDKMNTTCVWRFDALALPDQSTIDL